MDESDREIIIKNLVEFFKERGMTIVDIEDILEKVMEELYKK